MQEFTYLWPTITSNLSLNVEINKHIGKAASVMSVLSKRVWENNIFTENKVQAYQACVLGTLIYGSEAWTTYLAFVEDSLLQNTLSKALYVRKYNLKRLGTAPKPNEWFMGPADVNAYYDPGQNTIVFPAAILQKPMFDHSFPMSVNFGSIGAIMGHEISHAFDNRGRLFDKFGNLKEWWTKRSSKAYKKRTECMINQYNNFTVFGRHLNGLLTLGENIADSAGLKSSYDAYMSWLEDHEDPRANLPALNMNKEQLFFLSFAQMWCTHYTPQFAVRLLHSDSHANSMYRVIGTLSNTPQFAEAFSCPADSKMNPAGKCNIW
ncbi:hypothetical protein LSAT2_011234 [Lamellibrachia satsuma]|nr:hypothetical protein LSAT2_011234 [Lamellibrachia satsuma]